MLYWRRSVGFLALAAIISFMFQVFVFGTDCPSVLVLFDNSPWKTYGETLLSDYLLKGNVHLTYAENAAEITRQYVVQFHDVLKQTRSGQMTFASHLRSGAIDENELKAQYSDILDKAVAYSAHRNQAAAAYKELSSGEYSQFRRSAGLLAVDYGEETDYTDWSNKIAEDKEQRSFWTTIKSYNADILILGNIIVEPVGEYGGLYTCRGVVSARVIDVREEKPKVLKSFAAIANGIGLSEATAGQKVVSAAIGLLAKNLQGVVPCYVYHRPPTLEPPLGAVGMAVSGLQGAGESQDVVTLLRRVVEGALSQYSDIKLYTRSDLESVLKEQAFDMSGLVKSPVEIGKLVGVRYLVTGTITELKTHDESYYLDVPILDSLRITVRNISVGLSLSLIDVSTGAIIWTAERNKDSIGISIIGLEFNMNPLDQLRSLARRLVHNLYTAVIEKGLVNQP